MTSVAGRRNMASKLAIALSCGGERGDAMTITVTLTQWDYLRATSAMKYRSAAMKFVSIFFLGVSLLAGVLLLLPLLKPELELPIDSWLLELGLLAGPVFVLGTPLIWLLNIRSALKSNPSASGPQTYQLSEEGVRFSGGLYQTELKWGAITEVVETRDDFLFLTSKRSGYFLPKRALNGPEEVDGVREIVRRGAGGRAVLQSGGV